MVPSLTKSPTGKTWLLQLLSMTPSPWWGGILTSLSPIGKYGRIPWTGPQRGFFISFLESHHLANIEPVKLVPTSHKFQTNKVVVSKRLDKKLVIDWARQKNSTRDIRLAPLLRDIKMAYQFFEWFYFSHIL
jgi:hypothetical protein